MHTDIRLSHGTALISTAEDLWPALRSSSSLVKMRVRCAFGFVTWSFRPASPLRPHLSPRRGDHLDVPVDDASRLAHIETLPNDRQDSATGFLIRALAFFGRHGGAVERVMTGNCSAYRSRAFAVTVRSAALRHIRTRPLHAEDQKRFIQSSRREWAYARRSPTLPNEPAPCCPGSGETTRFTLTGPPATVHLARERDSRYLGHHDHRPRGDAFWIWRVWRSR
ncbi:DDE-type integrase/transposase/recombinase [Micromonospora sp. STR1s_5]|nr:DDE-type integrase/transposase/recombinase [Micromonospora sp. STR1s_5]